MNRIRITVIFVAMLFVVFAGCSRDDSQVTGPSEVGNPDGTAILARTDGMPPIACWSLDDGTGTVAADQCDGHDGTVFGATWGPGSCESALVFDDFGDYVAMPSGAWLTQLEGTIEAWVNIHPDVTGSRIFSNETAGWFNGFHLNWGNQLSNDEYINGGIRGGIHSTEGGNHYVETYVDNVSKGEWHFVAMTWDGAANTLSIFVDGISSTVTSPHPGVVNTGEPLTVGCYQNGTVRGAWFKGSIDEVKFYDRALSIDELNDHYLQGCGATALSLDIKPGSCPNPLNPQSRGVLPVAILGTAGFDVSEIDPSSLTLEGVPPLRWSIEDVSTPVSGDGGCECSTEGPDGYADLVIKFDTQTIVAALGSVIRGDVVVLTLAGSLLDGTPIEGSDCVVIKGSGLAASARSTVDGL